MRCTKLKKEKVLTVHITRDGPSHRYTEVIFASELTKYGFSEWTQMQSIIENHKGIHAEELKLALKSLIEKIKKLDLVLADKDKRPSTSSSAPKSSRTPHSVFLYPYGTRYIDNSLPAGVEPVQHFFIRSPEHGIFYMDSNHQMCFQRTSDLLRAQTEHLFHLRLECMGHVEQDGYHVLIALELVTRLEELGLDGFKWIKPEIINDAERAKKSAQG